MAADKSDITRKIEELSDVAAELPSGATKDALNAAIANLQATALVGLDAEGRSRENIEAMTGALPGVSSVFRPMKMIPGDGVIACC